MFQTQHQKDRQETLQKETKQLEHLLLQQRHHYHHLTKQLPEIQILQWRLQVLLQRPRQCLTLYHYHASREYHCRQQQRQQQTNTSGYIESK